MAEVKLPASQGCHIQETTQLLDGQRGEISARVVPGVVNVICLTKGGGGRKEGRFP